MGGFIIIEVLWMGVLVIFKFGEMFVVCYVVSYLMNVGFVDWMCIDNELYVVFVKDCVVDFEGFVDLW